jgi:hypothetical protein
MVSATVTSSGPYLNSNSAIEVEKLDQAFTYPPFNMRLQQLLQVSLVQTTLKSATAVTTIQTKPQSQKKVNHTQSEQNYALIFGEVMHREAITGVGAEVKMNRRGGAT